MAQVSKSQMIERFGREIQSGNAALFIGAGISKPSGYADWAALMGTIAKDLGLEISRETDLIALAQYHTNERGGRAGINRVLIEEFTRDAKLSEEHRLLAMLPVHAVWTTNYDDLIERAFREAHRRPDVKISPQNLSQTIPNRDVVVYKMHGDISQPHDAVLTKEDYELYDEKRALFSTALKGDLVERTFLFLGFSFTDPNIDYILSRIRALVGQNGRDHYCVMKWPDAPDDNSGEARAEYEYRKRKLELRVADLKRYHIHAVMIDSYYEIREMLCELNRRAHAKDVFVSGSAVDYAPLGSERIVHLMTKLGRELILRGFNLVSGFGHGIGGDLLLGALEFIYSEGLAINRVSIFPFPRRAPESMTTTSLYTNYRENMVSKAGYAIFVAGNRKDAQTGVVTEATGVLEEFEIAHRAGKIIIPIGATGWAARSIFDRVTANLAEFYGEVDVTGSLRVLGDAGATESQFMEAIFTMIERLGPR